MIQRCISLGESHTLFATLHLVMSHAAVDFSRQEYWSGLPCPPPGDLPDPGIEPASPLSPALAGEFFTTSAIWEAPPNTLDGPK